MRAWHFTRQLCAAVHGVRLAEKLNLLTAVSGSAFTNIGPGNDFSKARTDSLFGDQALKTVALRQLAFQQLGIQERFLMTGQQLAEECDSATRFYENMIMARSIVDSLVENNLMPDPHELAIIAQEILAGSSDLDNMLQKHVENYFSRFARGQKFCVVCIGCGSGDSEMKIFQHLGERGVDFVAIGLDPFIDLETHSFNRHVHCRVLNASLPHGQSLRQYLVTCHGVDPRSNFLCIEKFAFHHMACSMEWFRNCLEGTSLISVEEPIAAEKSNDLRYRLESVAFDLAANLALGGSTATSWIKAVLDRQIDFEFSPRLSTSLTNDPDLMLLTKVAAAMLPTYIATYQFPALSAKSSADCRHVA